MSFGQGGPYEAPGGSQPPQQPGRPPGQPPYQDQPPYQGQSPYPGQPPQQGQPFQQGQPDQSPGQGPTPDWAALADDTATRGRRRKWFLLGGGALATAAIAAIVATAVASSHRDKPANGLPAPQDLPSTSTTPEPTFSDVAPPPPPDPRDFIASAKKDTAPLSADTLFPGKKIARGSSTYAKAATDSTTNCAAATQGALGSVLTGNGCREVIRVTYVKGGVAVTAGVAVFDTKAAADKAKEQAKGNIASLAGGDAPKFCRGKACRLTTNSEGRYAYFTVSGYTNGTSVPASDTEAQQAGRDVATYVFQRVLARGEAQASAAAAAAR
ncbi:hypothetical protein AB0I22_18655 [Streptomyces sp. NPDC050610]|uniref:hypothetical protein n=1 Tax=Streptomyces sp. NPDC050610 TaxID=3157097 RepID=UPI003434C9DF